MGRFLDESGIATHFFDHLPVGSLAVSESGVILRANRRAVELLNREVDEVSGQPLISFVASGDRSIVTNLIGEVRAGLCEQCRVVVHAAPRERGVWWRLEMAVLSEDATVCLVTIEDVTLQRESEQRLRAAKEAAEEATRTKSAFLANMSHEIRTPLQTINGVAELFRDTQLDEEQREYLGQIQFAGDVLLGLINDVLDFSKIEAGQLQIEEIAFSPVQGLEEAVDLVSIQAHRKGLEVALWTDSSLPKTIVGDPTRIRQVLINLVNNAVKFTEHGSIVISGEARQTLSEPVLVVQVRDTGIGIEPSRQDRLFRPFSQVDASMTRRYGGTGLGLSISRDLVEMMGGRIGVESTVGVGSTFWFSVPLSSPSSSSAAIARPDALVRGFRLLIVDDNRESARILSRYITEWEGEVVVRESAAAALTEMTEALVGGMSFDLVLIDLRLPDMDGWQLASEIRNDPVLENSHLVLMSPTGISSGDAKMKLLRWFDGYINKPIKRVELASVVDSALGSDIEELEAIDLAALEERNDEEIDRSLTILVAEDHFVNQRLFQTILEKEGYRVLLAADGVEAVAVVEQHPEIDLIFMDVQMPNLNGYDATSRIRALGVTVPIVAVTANALSDERKRCQQAGMDEYLPKPFRKIDLERVIEKLRDEDRLSVVGKKSEGGVSMEAAAPTFPQGCADPTDMRPPPIDMDEAIEAFMGDEAIAGRVVRDFVNRLPQQLEDLKKRLKRGEFAPARVTAHAIKGGAWNLSCMVLGNVAKVTEDACAIEDQESAEQSLFDVRAEIERLRRYLNCQNEE